MLFSEVFRHRPLWFVTQVDKVRRMALVLKFAARRFVIHGTGGKDPKS